MLLLLSRFSRVQLCVTPQAAANQASRPWDSPGKNTGVGCHFLLQCMKVKSESEVAQSCPTRSNPMDCSHPGASIHGIFQAEVLEWGATAFSETIYKCPLTKLLCVNLIYFLHLHIKSVECRTCQLKLSINIYTNSKVTQYYLPTLLTKSKVKSMNFNIWLITTFLSTNMVYFPLKHKLTKVAYEFVL